MSVVRMSFRVWAGVVLLLVSTAGGARAERAVPAFAATPAERWAWEALQAGGSADFGKKCVPIEDASDCRVLSGIFLKEVLADPATTGSRQIIGAYIVGAVDLTGRHLASEFWFKNTTFADELNIDRTRFKALLAIDDSILSKGLSARGIEIPHLYLRRTTIRSQPVNLEGAAIGGDISFNGAVFESGLVADRARVAGSLFMNDAHVPNGPFRLVGADITGDVALEKALVQAPLQAARIRIGGALFLRWGLVTTAPEIVFSRIGGNLHLSAAYLAGMDLSGTVIAGALRLGSKDSLPPEWRPNALLNLSGTHVRVVQDSYLAGGQTCPPRDAWPDRLNLQGFVYEQLGADPGHDLRARETCWYKKWLERDAFNRQPYRQLAGVLRATGYPERADDVLYAARDREAMDAWTSGRCTELAHDWPWNRVQCFSALGLMLLRATIGYGIGSGVFRVLYWVAGFTVLGALVLRFSPAARAKGLAWSFGASLDQLLPIVQLNKEFSDFFDDPSRQRLSGGQLGYFAFHALVGYLLGSFVVAALAGLTQAGK